MSEIDQISHSLGSMHSKLDAQGERLARIEDMVSDQDERIRKVERKTWAVSGFFGVVASVVVGLVTAFLKDKI